MARTDRADLTDRQPDGGGAASRLKDWAPQIIIAVVVIIFIAVNRNKVSIDYVFGDVQMPLWLALAGVALLGGATGWFVGRRRLNRGD